MRCPAVASGFDMSPPKASPCFGRYARQTDGKATRYRRGGVLPGGQRADRLGGVVPLARGAGAAPDATNAAGPALIFRWSKSQPSPQRKPVKSKKRRERRFARGSRRAMMSRTMPVQEFTEVRVRKIRGELPRAGQRADGRYRPAISEQKETAALCYFRCALCAGHTRDGVYPRVVGVVRTLITTRGIIPGARVCFWNSPGAFRRLPFDPRSAPAFFTAHFDHESRRDRR